MHKEFNSNRVKVHYLNLKLFYSREYCCGISLDVVEQIVQNTNTQNNVIFILKIIKTREVLTGQTVNVLLLLVVCYMSVELYPVFCSSYVIYL